MDLEFDKDNENPTLLSTLGSWFDWGSDKAKFCLIKYKENTEIPWWMAITTSTIFLRLLVFPLRLRAWRNGQLLKLITEHCNKTITPVLRAHYQLKIGAGEVDKARLFKTDVLKAHSNLARSLGVSPWKSLSPLPLSIPLFLTTAAALRGIQFNGEGFWFWKDFGEAVGVSALPVALSNFIFIEYSRRRQQQQQHKTPQIQISDLSSNKKSYTFIKTKLPFIIGHSLNVLSMLILTSVPCGVNLFILTSSVFSIFESVFLTKSAKNKVSWLNLLIKKDFDRRISILKQNSSN